MVSVDADGIPDSKHFIPSDGVWFMAEPHYSQLLRKTGAQSNTHYFEPSILDIFRDDPNYQVTEFDIHTRDGYTDECSGLQQYVWARKKDGSPCVAVLLAHLRNLSSRDQRLWQAKELPPEQSEHAKIESRYSRPLLDGEFPDTISAYDAIFLYAAEINNIFSPAKFFPNLPDRPPDFLAAISFESERALVRFAQDLDTMLTIRPTTVEERICSSNEQENPEVARLKEKQKSRDLIRLYFQRRSNESDDIEDAIESLRKLSKLRQRSAHTIVPARNVSDHFEEQAELVRTISDGLRALLLGFAIVEGKTPNVEVLAYRVQ